MCRDLVHELPERGRRNVILAGPMGCGKTTLGEALAKKLGMPFLDTDRLIEAESGMSIREIFDAKGETGFRALERAAVRKACRLHNTIVAVGGGALLDRRNRAQVKGSGITIGLTASPEAILERTLSDGNRPLVSGESREERLSQIQKLLAPRRACLEELDFVIDTSHYDSAECLEAALANLREKGLPQPRAETDKSAPVAGVRTVRVDPPGSHGYAIQVGEGILARCGWLLRDVETSNDIRVDQVLIVTNHLLDLLYGPTVRESLAASGLSNYTYALRDSEATKSLAVASKIYDYMAFHKMGRDTLVLALGGGVIGDLAGFVASTYMRGVPFAQIPTSLLAQVDASVGGKVAVNHPAAKNLIGSFYQPVIVIADTLTLESLPDREYIEGLAEVVKYGIALDAELFDNLEEKSALLLARDRTVLGEIVSKCCGIKAAVVEKDERDRGQRAVLNFGHTAGHAVEARTGYGRMRHGEAVSVGMAVATRIAQRMGLMTESAALRAIGLLETLGLPTRTAMGMESLRPYLLLDKKAKGGKMTFVLPVGIGKCADPMDIEPDLVEEALTDCGFENR